MLGYVFKATNLRSGKEYIGKVRAVTFSKNYIGDDPELIEDVSKVGIGNFDIKMLVACETEKEIDQWYENYTSDSKPRRKSKKA